MIRPMLMSRAETWTVDNDKEGEEGLPEKTEMIMLQWILLGVSLKDKNRNEVIRQTLGEACTDKIREARSRL